MALTIADHIMGPSRGSVAQYVTTLDRPDQKDIDFSHRLWHWCGVAGIDYAGVEAWSDVETDSKRGPRWNTDLNPGGVGIPSDSTVQPFTIADADAAARIMVQCMYSAVNGRLHPDVPVPLEAQDWFNRVWLPKVTHPRFPDVTRWTDLDIRYDKNGDGRPESATWAWGFEEGQPAAVMAARANRFWPSMPNQTGAPSPPPPPTGGTTPMALTIRRSFVPAGNPNRPGWKLNNAPLEFTIHDTGNTKRGANAEMHRIFSHNGGGEFNVSFTFTVDDHEAIQLLPLDEVGFHAGDGCNSRTSDIGCFQSIAIEACINSDGSWAKTFDNLSSLMAAVIQGDDRIDFAGRKGQFSPGRAALHQKRSGKYCSRVILDNGQWPMLMADVNRKVGITPAPAPSPVPLPPPDSGIDYPDFLDFGIMERMFGSVTGEDGRQYRYTEDGVVSTFWRENYGLHGWPALAEVWSYDDRARRYFRFDAGPTIFVGGDGVPVIVK